MRFVPSSRREEKKQDEETEQKKEEMVIPPHEVQRTIGSRGCSQGRKNLLPITEPFAQYDEPTEGISFLQSPNGAGPQGFPGSDLQLEEGSASFFSTGHAPALGVQRFSLYTTDVPPSGLPPKPAPSPAPPSEAQEREGGSPHFFQRAEPQDTSLPPPLYAPENFASAGPPQYHYSSHLDQHQLHFSHRKSGENMASPVPEIIVDPSYYPGSPSSSIAGPNSTKRGSSHFSPGAAISNTSSHNVIDSYMRTIPSNRLCGEVPVGGNMSGFMSSSQSSQGDLPPVEALETAVPNPSGTGRTHSVQIGFELGSLSHLIHHSSSLLPASLLMLQNDQQGGLSPALFASGSHWSRVSEHEEEMLRKTGELTEPTITTAAPFVFPAPTTDTSSPFSKEDFSSTAAPGGGVLLKSPGSLSFNRRPREPQRTSPPVFVQQGSSSFAFLPHRPQLAGKKQTGAAAAGGNGGGSSPSRMKPGMVGSGTMSTSANSSKRVVEGSTTLISLKSPLSAALAGPVDLPTDEMSDLRLHASSSAGSTAMASFLPGSMEASDPRHPYDDSHHYSSDPTPLPNDKKAYSYDYSYASLVPAWVIPFACIAGAGLLAVLGMLGSSLYLSSGTTSDGGGTAAITVVSWVCLVGYIVSVALLGVLVVYKNAKTASRTLSAYISHFQMIRFWNFEAVPLYVDDPTKCPPGLPDGPSTTEPVPLAPTVAISTPSRLFMLISPKNGKMLSGSADLFPFVSRSEVILLHSFSSTKLERNVEAALSVAKLRLRKLQRKLASLHSHRNKTPTSTYHPANSTLAGPSVLTGEYETLAASASPIEKSQQICISQRHREREEDEDSAGTRVNDEDRGLEGARRNSFSHRKPRSFAPTHSVSASRVVGRRADVSYGDVEELVDPEIASNASSVVGGNVSITRSHTSAAMDGGVGAHFVGVGGASLSRVRGVCSVAFPPSSRLGGRRASFVSPSTARTKAGDGEEGVGWLCNPLTPSAAAGGAESGTHRGLEDRSGLFYTMGSNAFGRPVFSGTASQSFQQQPPPGGGAPLETPELTAGAVLPLSLSMATHGGGTHVTRDGFVVPDKNAIIRAYRADQPMALREVTMLVVSFSGFFDGLSFNRLFTRRLSHMFLAIVTEWAHYYGGLTLPARPDRLFVVWNSAALPVPLGEQKEVAVACGAQIAIALQLAKFDAGNSPKREAPGGNNRLSLNASGVTEGGVEKQSIATGAANKSIFDGFYPVVLGFSSRCLIGTMGGTQLQRRLVIFGRDVNAAISATTLLHLLAKSRREREEIDVRQPSFGFHSTTAPLRGSGTGSSLPSPHSTPLVDINSLASTSLEVVWMCTPLCPSPPAFMATFGFDRLQASPSGASELCYDLYALLPKDALTPSEVGCMEQMDLGFKALLRGMHREAKRKYLRASELWPTHPLLHRLLCLSTYFAEERAGAYQRSMPTWTIYGEECRKEPGALESAIVALEKEGAAKAAQHAKGEGEIMSISQQGQGQLSSARGRAPLTEASEYPAVNDSNPIQIIYPCNDEDPLPSGGRRRGGMGGLTSISRLQDHELAMADVQGSENSLATPMLRTSYAVGGEMTPVGNLAGELSKPSILTHPSPCTSTKQSFWGPNGSPEAGEEKEDAAIIPLNSFSLGDLRQSGPHAVMLTVEGGGHRSEYLKVDHPLNATGKANPEDSEHPRSISVGSSASCRGTSSRPTSSGREDGASLASSSQESKDAAPPRVYFSSPLLPQSRTVRTRGRGRGKAGKHGSGNSLRASDAASVEFLDGSLDGKSGGEPSVGVAEGGAEPKSAPSLKLSKSFREPPPRRSASNHPTHPTNTRDQMTHLLTNAKPPRSRSNSPEMGIEGAGGNGGKIVNSPSKPSRVKAGHHPPALSVLTNDVLAMVEDEKPSPRRGEGGAALPFLQPFVGDGSRKRSLFGPNPLALPVVPFRNRGGKDHPGRLNSGDGALISPTRMPSVIPGSPAMNEAAAAAAAGGGGSEGGIPPGAPKAPVAEDITSKQGLRFRLSPKVLGRGASGEVRLGLSHMGALVAVKIIEMVVQGTASAGAAAAPAAPAGGMSERAKMIQRRRLMRKGIASEEHAKETLRSLSGEIEMLSRLRHTCIVGYIGSIMEPGKPLMLVMEYTSGGSLQKLLDLFGELSAEQAVGYLKDVLHGLVYLHSQNIVHRDVKPENVLVSVSGGCKLIDFGISQQVSVATRAVKVDGTPFYMAPEAFAGNVTAKSDMWSFGVMLAEVFTREKPWPPNTNPVSIGYQLSHNKNFRPVVQNGALPPEAQEIFDACTQHDPKLRPTAHSVLQMPLFSQRAAGGYGQRAGVSAKANVGGVSAMNASVLGHFNGGASVTTIATPCAGAASAIKAFRSGRSTTTRLHTSVSPVPLTALGTQGSASASVSVSTTAPGLFTPTTANAGSTNAPAVNLIGSLTPGGTVDGDTPTSVSPHANAPLPSTPSQSQLQKPTNTSIYSTNVVLAVPTPESTSTSHRIINFGFDMGTGVTLPTILTESASLPLSTAQQSDLTTTLNTSSSLSNQSKRQGALHTDSLTPSSAPGVLTETKSSDLPGWTASRAGPNSSGALIPQHSPQTATQASFSSINASPEDLKEIVAGPKNSPLLVSAAPHGESTAGKTKIEQ